MSDELERALRQRDLQLLAQSRNPRGVAPQKAGPLDLGVGLKERLAFLNQTFNPVEAMGQSMGAGERLLSGDLEGYDQLAALGDMLSGVAGVAAPALVAGRAGIPAAKAATESLLGFSAAPQAAADEVFHENDFYKILTGQIDAPKPSELPPPPQAVILPEFYSRPPVPESSNPIGPRAGVGPARPSDAAAEALGFKDTVYHSTLSPEEFTQFDLSKQITGGSGRSFQDFLGVHVGTAKAASDRNIGASETAAGYSVLTPQKDRVVDPQGYTMELRARTDNPLTKEKFAEMLGVPVEQFFKKTDGPFQERDFELLQNEYANELLGTMPELARRYDENTIPRPLVAAYLRKDLADKGFTHIPYVNAVEDRGSTSFIMLTDRDGRSPAVLRDVRAQFDPSKVNDPDLRFNDGGPVAADDNPYSILNLDPDAFVAALDELGLQGEERKFLTDQYFAQSRALPMTSRPEGKTVRTILPIATPEGMTGAEALMSGDFDFTAPEILRGLYEGPAEAINVASAIGKGVPVTEDQVQQAGQVVPEMITGIGPATFAARSLARGVEMPDPSVVSMSGVGPRGMGDNGGPAMQPQRYINPETGMYSPSYEAAKALPQEVGTAQQMRSMLLKAGAKEEELVYSGFDNWLKGKDKVTKQEIEDILRVVAAGDEPSYDVYTGMKSPSSNMPYAQRQFSSKGITGSEGEDPYVIRRRLVENLQSQAIDERDARMLGELQGRGYQPLQIADETALRDMSARVRQSYENAVPGGFMPDGSRLPPARVLNTLERVERLMDRENMDFASPEIQRALRSLTEDTDFLIGPSGLPEFSDEIIRRELPDESINPYFGSLSTAERVRIGDQVEAMPEQEIANLLGISVEDVLNSFDGGDTQYGPYVIPGMRNYKENLYTYEDEGRGVMAGLESLGAQTFKQPHFSRSRAPIMFHTRTGELQTPEGPAYHMFEAQSDIAQTYRDRPNDFVAPGAQVQTPKMDKDQKAALSEYVDRAWDYQAAKQSMEENLQGLYDKFMTEDGELMRNAPGYEDARLSVRDARAEMDRLMERLIEIENGDNEFFGRVSDFYGATTMAQHSAYQTPFDPEQFEKILRGRANPKKGYGLSDRTGALPFSSSTNRWLDAALKSELIKAAKSDAQWFTLPKGKDVARVVGGDELGQQKFYEGIVPQRLKKLATDFLPGEIELKEIKAKGYGSRADEYDVLGMRLTPEIKKAILEGGLPSFAKGGPVQGSSLDVDVFALR